MSQARALICAFLALAIYGAAAKADDRPELPDGFVTFHVWAEMALFLDGTCPDIGIDFEGFNARSEIATGLLQDAGLEPVSWRFESRGLPDTAYDVVQIEFYDAMDVERTDFAAICDAAASIDITGETALAEMILIQ